MGSAVLRTEFVQVAVMCARWPGTGAGVSSFRTRGHEFYLQKQEVMKHICGRISLQKAMNSYENM